MGQGDDPDHKYRKERERIKDSDLADKALVLDFLESHHPDFGTEDSLSFNSLESYGRALRLLGDELDGPLSEQTAESLKAQFSTWLRKLSNKTVRQRQAAAIKFYDSIDAGPDGEEIPLIDVDSSGSVDERDMFSDDEVKALREACSNARDRCLLELLLYTGQRIRAIQTLRVKDVDPQNGVYWLNTEELGLKGADEAGLKRPLLGAKKAVREWLNHHPTGNADDYLITALPSATNTSGTGDYLAAPTIRSRLWRIADEAGVYDKETKTGKSPHPHNFRHWFVTTCMQRYGMEPSTIKFLIGHGQQSTVMEETYSHLTDEDHINAARAAAKGVGEEPETQESALTPEVCPTCDEPLGPSAKACPSCGDAFTPDALQAQDKMGEKSLSGMRAAETDEQADAVETIRDYLKNNPEEAVEILSEEL